jgi:hypothetical protein
VQNPNYGNARTVNSRRRPPNVLRQPSAVGFDDDELIVVGEREVELHASRPSRPPTEGQSVPESTQTSVRLGRSAYDATGPGRTGSGSLRNGMPSAQLAVHFDETNLLNTPGSMSFPGPSAYTERQNPPHEGGHERVGMSRKRSYSATQGPIDTDTFRSSQVNGMPSPTPESFGYVTNQGKYRCALCMTQLSSQQALEKHESIGKLHLANLKDPIVVSRGCARLAQITHLARTGPHQPHLPPLGLSNSSGFEMREAAIASGSGVGTNPDPRRIPAIAHDQQRSPQHGSSFDTIPNFDHALDSLSQHKDRNANNTSLSPSPGSEVIELFGIGNGKRRARSPQSDQHPAPSRPHPRPHLNPQPDQTSSSHHGIFPTSTANLDRAGPAISDAQNTDSSSQPNLPPQSQLAQILLSTGMHMAKKCIEEHPELIPHFYGCLKREVAGTTSSPGAMGFGDGGAGNAIGSGADSNVGGLRGRGEGRWRGREE